jgi:hypothetical protein
MSKDFEKLDLEISSLRRENLKLKILKEELEERTELMNDIAKLRGSSEKVGSCNSMGHNFYILFTGFQDLDPSTSQRFEHDLEQMKSLNEELRARLDTLENDAKSRDHESQQVKNCAFKILPFLIFKFQSTQLL